jgi:formylglycine-generating enzyme required for sulfatase activity
MDKEDLIPGQNWQREIPRALQSSALVLVCLSQNSAGRGYRQREFKLAIDALQEMPEDMIRTIPVRLEACEVPELFAPLQWCDLFEPNGFERLVRAIRYGLEQQGLSAPADPTTQPVSSGRPSVPEPSPELDAVEERLSESHDEPEGIPPQTKTSQAKPESLIELPQTFTSSIGMEFVLIQAGAFLMGTPAEQLDAIAGGDKDYRNWIENETPQHQVTINQPFYIGKYPVTQSEWQAVMGDNPSYFKGDNLPVERVSWDDVQAFIQKLNDQQRSNAYRLPTEAEWEYAARAGTTTRYSFGDDAAQLGEYAWYRENADGKTHPVGQKKPNAWSLYDMHGNVWEWMQDWYAADYYQQSPERDPQGPTRGELRVLRGGSWILVGQRLRSAYRYASVPGDRFDDFGFRLARGQKSQ